MKVSPIAAAVSLALLSTASSIALAQDGRTPAEIQAEIDRLNQELEQQKQALLIARATAPEGAAAPEAAPAVTETQQDTALGKVTVRAR